MNQKISSDSTSEPSQVVTYGADPIECGDGPIPPWWKWTLLSCLAFMPLYLLYHHGGASGRSPVDRYEAEVASLLQSQLEQLGAIEMNRESVVRFLYDSSWLQVGKATFRSRCASCHGKEGGGLIGPNLCDESYKNVRDIGDILNIVKNGAAGGAMPAWKSKLSKNEMVLVSSYVASLRGSSPSVAKPAEGSAIGPWPQWEPTEPVSEPESDPEPSQP